MGDGNFWFNPAAFAAPAAGTFGNAPRNLIYNPGEQQWDLALFKNFALGGTRRVQFRAEMFNFINHPNWRQRPDGHAAGQPRLRRPDQRELRSRDQQDRSARHPVEHPLPVLKHFRPDGLSV